MYYSRPELNLNSPDQPDTVVFLLSGGDTAGAESAAESIRGDGFACLVRDVGPEPSSARAFLAELSCPPRDEASRPPLILSDNPRILDLVLAAGLPAAGWVTSSAAAGSPGSSDDPGTALSAPFLVSDPGEVYPDDFVKIWQRQMGFAWTVFTTGRLTVRETTLSDIDVLREMLSDPETADRLPAVAAEYSGSRAGALLRLNQYIETVYPVLGCGRWSLCLKETGQMIGWAGLSLEKGEPELGYLIHPAFRRRGFALEACRAIVSYAAEELGFTTLIAEIPPDNVPSLGLIRRLGFIPAGAPEGIPDGTADRIPEGTPGGIPRGNLFRLTPAPGCGAPG